MKYKDMTPEQMAREAIAAIERNYDQPEMESKHNVAACGDTLALYVWNEVQDSALQFGVTPAGLKIAADRMNSGIADLQRVKEKLMRVAESLKRKRSN